MVGDNLGKAVSDPWWTKKRVPQYCDTLTSAVCTAYKDILCSPARAPLLHLSFLVFVLFGYSKKKNSVSGEFLV